MKNLLKILLTLVVVLWLSVAWAFDFVDDIFIAVASTACIGAPDGNTNCNYTTSPTPAALSDDSSRMYSWTATVDGTMSRVKLWRGDCPTDGTLSVAVYVNNQLRATAAYNACTGLSQWGWSDSLSSYSGRSLDFETGDVVKFGLSFDYNTDSFSFGRWGDSTTPNYYSESAYLPDPWTDTTSSNYDTAAILEYTYVP